MRRLSSLLLALCAGCGAVLAYTSPSGIDRGAVRPEEQDALLLCGGHRCDAAPLQREYDKRLNKTGYLVGTGVDAGLFALGIGLSRGEGNTLSGVVLGLSALFVAFDIVTPLQNGGFGGTAGPWTLAQPVTTDLRGQRLQLDTSYLLENGNPLRTFSLAALQERLRADATLTSDGGICLRYTGWPSRREDMVIAVFDAKDEGADLHPETIRYLSDVLRASAAAVAPDARFAGPQAMAKAAGCDEDCMAQRMGANFAITGSVRKKEGERHYSVRASQVPSGAVIATATASGKNLDELDAAVRKLAARLFGCRE